MIIKKIVPALLVAALAVPAFAAGGALRISAAKPLISQAHQLATDIEDRALASLYERLFALQDLRRNAELEIDKAELLIDDNAMVYNQLDRRIDKDDLKEIAVDPRDRRYPNITEKTKLAILQDVRKLLRTQTLSALEVKKIDRDIEDVRRMIEAHLNKP